ncbi:MAG: 30S ribosomal protein S4 [bacterium]|nr:30S ribosomal protein S4 [bacterium]
MARYTGPKMRLMRREGVDLGLKSYLKASIGKRLTVPPGMHGQKGKRKTSSYGVQLREKQKVRVMYGLGERQFVRFFNLASKTKGATGELFLQLLERRLDNVLYRLGFAPTRAAARQFVNHGHVKVDEKRVSIPSFIVEPGMIVSLYERALKIPSLTATAEVTKDGDTPAWLEKKGMVGKIKGLPTREDIATEIDESLIVEYYSR